MAKFSTIVYVAVLFLHPLTKNAFLTVNKANCKFPSIKSLSKNGTLNPKRNGKILSHTSTGTHPRSVYRAGMYYIVIFHHVFFPPTHIC